MHANSQDRTDTRWFRERLSDAQLSQRKLAQHLHLDPAAVSLMLRGKRKMSTKEATELAKLLRVPVQEVVLRAGNTATVPVGHTVQFNPPAAKAPPEPDMLELPVPLEGGGAALLRLPRRLKSVDAERISALVMAFAVRE